MKILKGDFLQGFEDPQGLVLAPANGVIVPAGLVMGAGAALALAEAVPGARQALARAIEAKGTRYPEGYWMYGLAVAAVGGRSIGAFQTKAHFRDNANAGIVRLSAGLLAQWMAAHPDFRVHLAYPGIGLGRLEPGLVERVLRKCLEGFQDRVFLYRL